MQRLKVDKGQTRLRDARGVARLAALCAAYVLGLVFAAPARAAAGGAPALREGDVRKAEKVLSRLRLLYNAAEADDGEAYRALASKLYPGLFVTVAEMRPSDLTTDLSTAVFLAEGLGRGWAAAGATAADCRRERPDIYQPLCYGLRGGTVRQLLLAKARLHARWAEAALRSHRGESDAETSRALREMASARANDALIAARVLETLRTLEGSLPRPSRDAERGGQHAAPAAGLDGPGGAPADALRIADALLAWMPRGPAFYELSGAQRAYADGLSWYRRARRSKRLVVSVNDSAPDSLKVLGLTPEQVAASAEANWKSAVRLTRRAEHSLAQAAR